MTTTNATSVLTVPKRDVELLTALEDKRQTLRITLDAIQRLEYEVILRISERRGRALIAGVYTAELDISVSYDQSRFTPLLEILPSEAIRECYVPAHEEVVQIPAKWKSQQVLKWARRLGTKAQNLVDAARMEGAPKIRLTHGEGGSIA